VAGICSVGWEEDLESLFTIFCMAVVVLHLSLCGIEGRRRNVPYLLTYSNDMISSIDVTICRSQSLYARRHLRTDLLLISYSRRLATGLRYPISLQAAGGMRGGCCVDCGVIKSSWKGKRKVWFGHGGLGASGFKCDPCFDLEISLPNSAFQGCK
jgi:hypothetical protein